MESARNRRELLNILLCGKTGSGKSSFVNTVAKLTNYPPPAVEQDAGGEGTQHIGDYEFPGSRYDKLRLVDSRGTQALGGDAVEKEFYDMLVATLKPGDLVERNQKDLDDRDLTEGVDTSRKRPWELINVMIWFIAATDPQLQNPDSIGSGQMNLIGRAVIGDLSNDSGPQILVAVTKVDLLPADRNTEEERERIKHIICDKIFQKRCGYSQVYFITNYSREREREGVFSRETFLAFVDEAQRLAKENKHTRNT